LLTATGGVRPSFPAARRWFLKWNCWT